MGSVPAKQLTWGVCGVALVALAGCGGSSSGNNGGGGGPAITALSFDTPALVGAVGVELEPLVALATPPATSFSILPNLPAGLVLNASTGEISGAATQPSARTSYTMRANQNGQAVKGEFDLEIVQPARLLLVTHQTPGSPEAFSSMAFNAKRGDLMPQGLQFAAEELRASDIQLHPTADLAVWISDEQQELQSVALDRTTGQTAVLDTLSNSSPISNLSFDPSGEYLFALASSFNQVQVFSINPFTGASFGALTSVAAQPVGGQPQAMLQRDSQLFVADANDDSLHIFDFNAFTGSLSVAETPLVLGTDPKQMIAHSQGIFLISDSVSNALTPVFLDPVTSDPSVGTVFNLDGNTPSTIQLDASERFLYALSDQGLEVIELSFDEDGALEFTSIETDIEVPKGANQFALDPSGAFAAISSDNEIALFELSRATGQANLQQTYRTRPGIGQISWVDGAGPLPKTSDLLLIPDSGNSTLTKLGVNTDGQPQNPVGSQPFAGPEPFGSVIGPFGRFSYVADATLGTITGFSLNQQGNLGSIGASPTPSSDLRDLFIDATGRFLYAASFDNGGLYAFEIDQGPGAFVPGDLILLANPFTPSGAGARVLISEPTGRFLYAANEGSGPGTRSVSHFGMNSATGELTDVVGGVDTPINAKPTSMVAHPNGRVLFISFNTLATGALGAWQIDPNNGNLSSPFALPIGDDPRSLAVHPSGRFLAVCHREPGGTGSVGLHPVDPATGQFGAASIFVAGTNPIGCAFSPDGSLLYVANETSADLTIMELEFETGEVSVIGNVTGFGQPQAVLSRTRQL